MRHLYLIGAIVLFVVLTTSCRKDREKQQPTPPPAEAEFSRTFHYKDTDARQSVNYHTDSGKIGVATFVENGKFNFAFHSLVAENKDYVRFTAAPIDIEAGVGTHVIEFGTGNKVEVTYVYKLDQGTNIFFPGSFQGQLKITKYDKGLRLIDGELSVVIKSDTDPTKGVPAVFRQTDVILTCKFENVAVPERP